MRWRFQLHAGLLNSCSLRSPAAKDREVGHLFFDYFDNLKDVNLRYLHGSELGAFFQAWLDSYPNPYPQRYRKSIPFNYVKRNGRLLMTLKDGEVVFPVLAGLATGRGDREAVSGSDVED